MSPVHTESLPLISRVLQKHRHWDHRTQFLRGVLCMDKWTLKLVLLPPTWWPTHLLYSINELQCNMIWVQILGKFPRLSCFRPGDIVLLCFFIWLSQITQVKHSTGPALFWKPKSQQQLSEFLTQFSPQGDLKVKAEVPTVAYCLEDAARSVPCYPSDLTSSSSSSHPFHMALFAISGTCQAHPTLGPLYDQLF